MSKQVKQVLLLATGSIFFLTAVSFAENEKTFKKHNLEFGPQVSYINYEEPGLMEEKGLMYGIEGSYAYHNDFMLKAEADFSYGELDYSSTSTGDLDSIPNYKFEIRGLAGWDFPISKTSYLTPFTGIGYRYLQDDSLGMRTTTGAVGYERESNYFYSPVGIEVLTNLNDGWALGSVIEYDYFWAGKQISRLGDAIAGLNNVENEQNTGWGLRGSIKIKKKLEDMDLLIEPYARYWKIDKSENSNITYNGVIVGYGYEPNNESTEIGIKLAIGF